MVRIRPKRPELHELPYTEMVKSGTIRLATSSEEAPTRPTVFRSLVSEKVLEKLPASCKYADHGCQVKKKNTGNGSSLYSTGTDSSVAEPSHFSSAPALDIFFFGSGSR